jgi:serine/threonine protein kinase
MATKPSADSFLSSVRLSGLVDDSQLRKFWQGFEQSGKDPQVTEVIASGMVDSQILTRWQVDKLLQGKHKGFFLGKYKLLSLLGSGGMSAVYLAEHTLMKRRVAIKVLPQIRIEDTSYLERFHREAQAVATLDHPNIMRAYDVDQEGKIHFLVMEFIDGQSLLEIVSQRGALPYVEAAELMRQSADGLAHAHARGMIHRDIKPGNILVDKNGVVKILDMGLAMFFDPTGKEVEQASLTIQHDELVLGTADYLSPEQALNSHNVDVRTDIYSLGCTFYFILTGHPPFPEGSLAQRLLFHQTRAPDPVENDRPDVPASLVVLLTQMMEKRAEDRFQTAREVYEALTRWLIENGDGEWRERNAALISGSGSNIHGASTLPTGSSGSSVKSDSTVKPNSSTKPPSTVKSGGSAKEGPAKEGSGKIRKNAGSAVPPTAVPVARPVLPPTAAMGDVSKPVSSQNSSGASELGKPHPRRPNPTTTSTPAAPGWSPTVPTPNPPPVETATGVAAFTGFDEIKFEQPTVGRKAGKSSTKVVPATTEVPTAARDRTSFYLAPIRRMFRSKSAQGMFFSICAFVVVVLCFSYYFTRSAGQRKPPVRAKKDEVEFIVGGNGKYKTLSEAIAAVKEAAGSKPQIRVMGSPVFRERLDLSRLPPGTEILADVVGGPTLAPLGPEPIMDINGLHAFKLDGFNLDAKGKEVAIRVAGAVPRLSISQCSVTGFTRQGVLAVGLVGDETNRVSFDGLTFNAGQSDARGFVLASGSLTPAYIVVENCRFLGPMATGIEIDSDGETLTLERNLFSQIGIGIRFQGADRTYKRVSITNNTFYLLQQGIVFSHMPDAKTERIGVFNCLFSEIQGAEFKVEQGFDRGQFSGLLHPATANNWTDKPAIDGNAVIFGNGGRAATAYHFKSVKPSDPDFLAPSDDSPQRSTQNAGPSDWFVGAVGPR